MSPIFNHAKLRACRADAASAGEGKQIPRAVVSRAPHLIARFAEKIRRGSGACSLRAAENE